MREWFWRANLHMLLEYDIEWGKYDILGNPCCKLQWEFPKIANVPLLSDFLLYDEINIFIQDFFPDTEQLSSA